MQAQDGDGAIDPTLSQYGTIRRWVVGITPRPPYPQESHGTHCTESWVELGIGLNGCRKSRRHKDSIPELPSP